MEDGKEKKWIKDMCDRDKFSFTYDGITDINPNSNHKTRSIDGVVL